VLDGSAAALVHNLRELVPALEACLSDTHHRRNVYEILQTRLGRRPAEVSFRVWRSGRGKLKGQIVPVMLTKPTCWTCVSREKA
jgi:hypothetical protein